MARSWKGPGFIAWKPKAGMTADAAGPRAAEGEGSSFGRESVKSIGGHDHRLDRWTTWSDAGEVALEVSTAGPVRKGISRFTLDSSDRPF